MKAIQIQERFGLDALVRVELPDPTPGPGQVVVQVRAASLNYRDLMMVEGRYNARQPLPLIPLSDGAGEVVAVGSGVTRVKIGDRVMGNFCQEWLGGEFQWRYWTRTCLGGPLPGMLREYALLSEQGVVPIPDHLTYEEAATLPCAAVTAWNALVCIGQIRAGETVLIQGTGGVSLFALQFARMHGARIIATSSSDTKLAKVREMGASEGINYKTTPDWDAATKELTSGAGVDHIVEVGGAGTLPRSLRAIRPGGKIHLIGVLSSPENPAPIDPAPILNRAIQVRGLLVGSREMFEEMNRAIRLHELRPVIDRVFPWEEAREALEYVRSGAHFGKVVLSF